MILVIFCHLTNTSFFLLPHFHTFTISHFHTLTISQFHTFTSPQLVYASDIFPSSSSIPGSWLGFAAVPRGDRSSACVVNLYWFEKVMTLNYIISIDPDLWRNRKLFPRLIDLAAPPVLFAANNKEKASGLFAGHGQDKLQVLEAYLSIFNFQCLAIFVASSVTISEVSRGPSLSTWRIKTSKKIVVSITKRMKSHYTLERLDNFEHIWKTAKLELHTLINARFDCFASLSLLLCAYQLSTVRLSAPKPLPYCWRRVWRILGCYSPC